VRSCLLVVVFRFLRCCLSSELRRLASMVLVFLRFLLYLLLVVLLRRLHPQLSCGRQLCRFYPLLRVRARVSTNSIMVRTSSYSPLHLLQQGWTHYVQLLYEGSQFASPAPGLCVFCFIRLFCSCPH
jgi:hypothetical protein